MTETERILQLILTFLPVYGIILTIVFAVLRKGDKRILALALVPIITLGICSFFGDMIAYNGNMLYVTLVLMFFLGLFIYYPALLIYYIIVLARR